jgi:hypothetical protein
MTAVQIMMPEQVKQKVTEVAHRRHVSFDKVVTIALMRELAKVPDPLLERRAARGCRADFDAFLAQVPDVSPKAYDKMK